MNWIAGILALIKISVLLGLNATFRNDMIEFKHASFINVFFSVATFVSSFFIEAHITIILSISLIIVQSVALFSHRSLIREIWTGMAGLAIIEVVIIVFRQGLQYSEGNIVNACLFGGLIGIIMFHILAGVIGLARLLKHF